MEVDIFEGRDIELILFPISIEILEDNFPFERLQWDPGQFRFIQLMNIQFLEWIIFSLFLFFSLASLLLRVVEGFLSFFVDFDHVDLFDVIDGAESLKYNI